MRNIINIIFLIATLNFVQVITHDVEARIVKGNLTSIQKHPHSVFLYIMTGLGGIMCGGSILNQRVVLTAAHCFDELTDPGRVTAGVGSSHTGRGSKINVISVRIHPKYSQEEIVNDIALAGLEYPVVFGSTVKRIAIANEKPSTGLAKLAGWGAVQELPIYRFSDYLHEVSVPFMFRKKCKQIYKNMDRGTFCGGKLRATSHPTVGDSGSALVFENYLQIGIVSYKMNKISRSMIIYTDVPYFYKWIQINAKTVFCDKKKITLPSSNKS